MPGYGNQMPPPPSTGPVRPNVADIANSEGMMSYSDQSWPPNAGPVRPNRTDMKRSERRGTTNNADPRYSAYGNSAQPSTSGVPRSEGDSHPDRMWSPPQPPGASFARPPIADYIPAGGVSNYPDFRQWPPSSGADSVGSNAAGTMPSQPGMARPGTSSSQPGSNRPNIAD